VTQQSTLRTSIVISDDRTELELAGQLPGVCAHFQDLAGAKPNLSCHLKGVMAECEPITFSSSGWAIPAPQGPTLGSYWAKCFAPKPL